MDDLYLKNKNINKNIDLENPNLQIMCSMEILFCFST